FLRLSPDGTLIVEIRDADGGIPADDKGRAGALVLTPARCSQRRTPPGRNTPALPLRSHPEWTRIACTAATTTRAMATPRGHRVRLASAAEIYPPNRS